MNEREMKRKSPFTINNHNNTIIVNLPYLAKKSVTTLTNTNNKNANQYCNSTILITKASLYRVLSPTTTTQLVQNKQNKTQHQRQRQRQQRQKTKAEEKKKKNDDR